MPWTLDNAEERAAEAPRSFFIPSASVRNDLRTTSRLRASCSSGSPADEPPALLLLGPDGEWEAHADPETDAEVEDAENVLHWTLGYLSDRFPQTTDALREGAAGNARDVWWRWDGTKYVRYPDLDAEPPPDR